MVALKSIFEEALLGEEYDFVIIFIEEGEFHSHDLDEVEYFVHLSYFRNLLLYLLITLLSAVLDVVGLGPTVEVAFDILASR